MREHLCTILPDNADIVSLFSDGDVPSEKER